MPLRVGGPPKSPLVAMCGCVCSLPVTHLLDAKPIALVWPRRAERADPPRLHSPPHAPPGRPFCLEWPAARPALARRALRSPSLCPSRFYPLGALADRPCLAPGVPALSFRPASPRLSTTQARCSVGPLLSFSLSLSHTHTRTALPCATPRHVRPRHPTPTLYRKASPFPARPSRPTPGPGRPRQATTSNPTAPRRPARPRPGAPA